jgi:aminopeptidase N
VVEHPQPGGHGPPYFVMMHNPPAFQQVRRNDPADFPDFDEFVLAHEVAHQWWGQAVGWKNYHEQWLSEGFAQYFAALYAQERHGPAQFERMLRQFRKWALDESDQGPVHLGYRLGQIRGDRRVFRALLYNKGAAVLHMLRRLVGDDVFFASLRRFYQTHKFQKADTDDLRQAFETESGMDLGRFFDRWIYESAIPRIGVQQAVGDRDVVVTFTQLQDRLFDLPVTVTLTYEDGRTMEIMVPVTEAVVEHRIPVDGPIRSVEINRDSAAIAEFED